MRILRGVKRSFWRGLAALVPALLTIIVLVLGISFIYNYLGKYVNLAIIHVLAYAIEVPVDRVEQWYAQYWLGWVGVVVAIVGVCVAAYFLGTFIGSRIYRFFETWVVRAPLLRRIYPGAKQVSEFFFSERAVEFSRVVAIEYPRRGVWSVGFVTGRSFRALSKHTEQELLTVFVPSSPTPVTGYIVAVPRREVIDLPISVEEAFQYTISAGVITPPAERVESLSVALQVTREEARAAFEKGQDEADAEAKEPSSPPTGESAPPGPSEPAEDDSET
jgi:uncharacterized membrane protein